MRIARFTAGEDPLFGVVSGELDEFGQPAEDSVVVELVGDPLYAGIQPTQTEHRFADVRLLAPVIPRSKVVAIGKNYAAHAAEMGGEVPEEPLMFLKPNTAVVGPGDQIFYPSQSERVDYEGELAVVIGRICRDVPPEQATDVILGYTIANDVTARDLQKRDVQFTRAKGFDSFCPLGPWIETDLDPQTLRRRRPRADAPQRRPRAGRLHEGPDLRHPDAGGPRDQRDDAPARRRDPDRYAGGRRSDAAGRRGRGVDRGTRRADEHGGTTMTSPQPGRVRVRFCPSPTGSPHVGLARTALFNWAFARHHGGDFVFRIEDTDAARDSQESYDTLLEVMHWLGFDWDEGPEVGGPHAPYRQSERTHLYTDVLSRLREAGRTYDCYCTNEEVEARRKASGSKLMGYDGFCRELTARAGRGVRGA